MLVLFIVPPPRLLTLEEKIMYSIVYGLIASSIFIYLLYNLFRECKKKRQMSKLLRTITGSSKSNGTIYTEVLKRNAYKFTRQEINEVLVLLEDYKKISWDYWTASRNEISDVNRKIYWRR